VKHTNGPWLEIVGRSSDRPEIYLDLGEGRYAKATKDALALMAAAPELLAALEALEAIGVLEDGLLGTHGVIPEAQRKARAAIARAKGQA
jgi:hypothetical protein